MNSSNIDFDNVAVYIIHISKNKERFDLIESQREKLKTKNINVIEAVTPENICDFSLLTSYSDLSVHDTDQRAKRFLCCTLSHRITHQTAWMNGDDYYIILEDDFKILDSFEEWKSKVKEKSFEFDIMPMGGYHSYYDDSDWFHVTDDEVKEVKQITCSVANLYTRKSTLKFISAFDTKFNVKNYDGADGFYAKYVYSILTTKTLFPLPIVTHACKSDISKSHVDHEQLYRTYFNQMKKKFINN